MQPVEQAGGMLEAKALEPTEQQIQEMEAAELATLTHLLKRAEMGVQES
jgi:hypothetical protein